jgi:hypothetical protein
MDDGHAQWGAADGGEGEDGHHGADAAQWGGGDGEAAEDPEVEIGKYGAKKLLSAVDAETDEAKMTPEQYARYHQLCLAHGYY